MDRMSHKCIIIIIKNITYMQWELSREERKEQTIFFLNYFSWDRHQTIDLGSLENTKQNKKQNLN